MVSPVILTVSFSRLRDGRAVIFNYLRLAPNLSVWAYPVCILAIVMIVFVWYYTGNPPVPTPVQ
jgi:hypothetical protein